MIHFLSEVLHETTMITAFVLIIMLFIEVLNVATQGSWSKSLSRSPFWQIVLGALLGSIPGCFGGFAAVSMYTHGIFHFGALMAAMVSNIGDEAFVMLVQMPQKTALLMLGLFFLSLLVGWLCWRLGSGQKAEKPDEHFHFEIHHDDYHSLGDMAKDWKLHLKNMSFPRALLMMGLLSFIAVLLLGGFEHSHEALPMTDAACAHGDGHLHLPLDEKWFNMIFLVLAVLVLFTIVLVNDHFLEHHLWGHVIKHHFLKIFLWVFLALSMIYLINEKIITVDWMNQNPLLLLLLAVLIGLIPQSGPHLIFIGLYLGGHIPFVILLANSIVQDGHSALPLFAESKKTFFAMKGLKAAIALILGLLMLYCPKPL